ncbi:MAG TPA: sugar ABC transporter permease [Clostridia bacterium]
MIYFIFFLLPTLSSLFFSMTWWTLDDWEFIGLENFVDFFSETSLNISFKNTLIYAALTSGMKVILALFLGVFLASPFVKTRNYLRSVLFFPNLLSTLAVGLAFQALKHPTRGVINTALGLLGITGPDWLGNVKLALFSVALVDIWKGVGIATVIYIAGIASIPAQYYEAVLVDGGNAFDKFRYITLPLVRPARNSVIILSFIGGLRTFDLIMVMTKGGPGFTTYTMSYVIYKLYTNSLYGLSTAGNVIMFIFIAVLAYPLYKFITRTEVDL